MPVRLDGLQSGMDTTALIGTMIDAQRIPYTRKENQIFDNESKLYAWSQLDTKLTELNTKTVALNSYKTWQQKTAASGDEDILTATATRDAANGSYTITASQLAQKHRIGSDSQASTTSELGFSGDFTIGGESVTVALTDTLKDVRDKINDASANMDADEKVNATIIGTTLVLERDKTGATNIDISEDGANRVLRDLGVLSETKDTDPATTYSTIETGRTLQTAEDLSANINGVIYTGSENTGITDAIEEVTLNFDNKSEGETTTVDITNDKETIKSLLNEFITAYNEAMELAENATSASIGSEDDELESLGILQGDSLANEIRNKSRGIITAMETDPNNIDQAFNTLQKIGIWTSGRENRLSIVDEEALDDALENNFDEVEDLFRDYEGGVMRKMQTYTDSLIGPVDGLVVKRQTNLENNNDKLEDEIQEFEDSIPDKEAELYERFAKMETQLAELQSASGFIMSSLGGSK
ncbi:hypothetical protein BVY04_01970 [bacterium M21]|nr:hypothetical protein BVY04_01970 [bacterium M21]